MVFMGAVVRTKDSCPAIFVSTSDAEGDAVAWTYRASAGIGQEEQQYQLARAFRSYLVELDGPIEVLVLREADDGRRGGETSSRKCRFRCEGAVIAIAREHCEHVHLLNGQQTAARCGVEKIKTLDERHRPSNSSDHAAQAASALDAARVIGQLR